MPGVARRLRATPRTSRSGRRTACRPARGAGSGTRRRRSRRPAPSRRRWPGPARGSCPGRAAPATWYIRSRQVQNVPPSSWVRPRMARWKACECALAKPGSTSPASRPSPGSARHRALDRGDHAGLLVHPHAGDRARRPTRPARTTTCVTARSLSHHVGERRDPGQAVVELGVLQRASARPRSGCGRRAWTSRCRPGSARRRRGPHRSPAPGPGSPRSSSACTTLADSVGSNGVRGVQDSSSGRP